MMPTRLSNLNVFILQDRDSPVSQPLRVGRILQYHLRVATPSLFGDKERWRQAAAGTTAALLSRRAKDGGGGEHRQAKAASRPSPES